jgi:hypothetical protein
MRGPANALSTVRDVINLEMFILCIKFKTVHF